MGLPALRSTPAVVVQSIQDGNGDEPSLPRPGWLGPDPLRNPLPNPLVWPCAVEVFDVFLDHAVKLPFPDNQEVIEAFSPHAPYEPLADRVGLWSAIGGLEDFNGAYLSSTCEVDAVLAVPVADQETRGWAIGVLAKNLVRGCLGDSRAYAACL